MYYNYVNYYLPGRGGSVGLDARLCFDFGRTFNPVIGSVIVLYVSCLPMNGTFGGFSAIFFTSKVKIFR